MFVGQREFPSLDVGGTYLELGIQKPPTGPNLRVESYSSLPKFKEQP